MSKEQATRDVQTQLENLYTKLDFRWRGMQPDGGAGSIAKNRVRLALNARFRNGDIEGRGGQRPLINDFAVDDTCVTSLLDANGASRRSLFLFAFGCPGAVTPGLAFSIATLDNEQEPPLQFNIYKDLTLFNMTGEQFAGKFWLCADNKFSRYTPIDQYFGQDALSIGGTRQDVHLFDLPSPFTHAMAMKAFDARLFIAANGGVGTSAVLAFDGRTLHVIDLPAINPPVGFGVWHEKLLTGFDAGTGPNELRVRDVGDPPGTWAVVTPTGGTCYWGRQFSGDGAQAAGSGNGAGVSYRDTFWLASGTEDVFAYTGGATILQVTPATTLIAAGSITIGFEVHRGKLYLLYQTAADEVRLASFDGTTWVPVVADLTAIFSGEFTLTDGRCVRSYRQALYVLGRSIDLGDSAGRIMISKFGVDVDGVNWFAVANTGTTSATDFSFGTVF